MDTKLVLFINGLHTPTLDKIAQWLSRWSFWFAPIVFLLLLLLYRKSVAAIVRDGLLVWLLSLTISEEIIKPWIGRLRPTAYPALLHKLHIVGRAPPASSLSCPSGTATFISAIAAWAWMYGGKSWGIFATSIAVIVSLSRVYLGVHYLTDVLAGACVGVLIAFVVQRFSRWAGTLPKH